MQLNRYTWPQHDSDYLRVPHHDSSWTFPQNVPHKHSYAPAPRGVGGSEGPAANRSGFFLAAAEGRSDTKYTSLL